MNKSIQWAHLIFEKIFCLHFDDFTQLLKELISITLSTKQLIQTIVFWTSSVHIYQSLQFQIKIYVICWLWFQLENKQKWQEFLIFICKCFSFLILCDCADTLPLFFMILEILSKSFQLQSGISGKICQTYFWNYFPNLEKILSIFLYIKC